MTDPTEHRPGGSSGAPDDPATALLGPYLEPVEREICGPLDARALYIFNRHPDRAIVLHGRIDWIYEGKACVEFKNYHCPPQQYTWWGCPIPGPSLQRFDYSPVAWWFADSPKPSPNPIDKPSCGEARK